MSDVGEAFDRHVGHIYPRLGKEHDCQRSGQSASELVTG